jgi:hypothetical protein
MLPAASAQHTEQARPAEPDGIGRAHTEQDARQKRDTAPAAAIPMTAPMTTGRNA